jgi:hypothetical protein
MTPHGVASPWGKVNQADRSASYVTNARVQHCLGIGVGAGNRDEWRVSKVLDGPRTAWTFAQWGRIAVMTPYADSNIIVGASSIW